MNNDYCIMYNGRFGLAAEAFLFKNVHLVNHLSAIGYVNNWVDFGQFELIIRTDTFKI
jgi:hypothetical protein